MTEIDIETEKQRFAFLLINWWTCVRDSLLKLVTGISTENKQVYIEEHTDHRSEAIDK